MVLVTIVNAELTWVAAAVTVAHSNTFVREDCRVILDLLFIPSCTSLGTSVVVSLMYVGVVVFVSVSVWLIVLKQDLLA